MISLINFKAGHLRNFKSKKDLPTIKADLEAAALDSRYELASLQLDTDNTIIAIIGLLHIKKGVAEVFLIPSIHVNKYKISFFKIMKRIVTNILDGEILHRVQMTIEEHWEHGKKWARALGFKEEGLMHGYGPNGGNEYMFARCL